MKDAETGSVAIASSKRFWPLLCIVFWKRGRISSPRQTGHLMLLIPAPTAKHSPAKHPLHTRCSGWSRMHIWAFGLLSLRSSSVDMHTAQTGSSPPTALVRATTSSWFRGESLLRSVCDRASSSASLPRVQRSQASREKHKTGCFLSAGMCMHSTLPIIMLLRLGFVCIQNWLFLVKCTTFSRANLDPKLSTQDL
ncbi:hypothetical protein NEDG_00911 [Nematocida displodere]|uniref:Uncharacterized protein n=1 Tax=Nematocida displodere TaxID=1805483 RepID=A0A177ED80_9MICR|nr:hypothetical protein NEDG_00911 [Nematocida displodere]